MTRSCPFQAVVFLSTTGDILNEEQKAAFQRYIRAGGGFVGVHSADDTEKGWAWYMKLLGRMFKAHRPTRRRPWSSTSATSPAWIASPSASSSPREWHEFGPALSDGLKVLLSVDERTHDASTHWVGSRPGMGASHPISWYQHFEGGRSFYTALGHLPGTYADDCFLHHLFGGIYWAATGKGFSAD